MKKIKKMVKISIFWLLNFAFSFIIDSIFTFFNDHDLTVICWSNWSFRRRYFLRRNSYIPKIWGNFSFPPISIAGFSWGKRKSKKSAKQPKNITIRLNRYDQEKYLHSFLKKRILATWKEQRANLQMTSLFHSSPEKELYQNTYNRLKPLLLASFTEDFKEPYTEFAFRSWLQYVKILAQITGRYRDARQWEELGNFMLNCTQLDLVD